MPFMDAYIPEGALSQTAERELIGKLSDLLIEHEGVDPANETVRRMTWVSVHRPEVYVGGGPTRSPPLPVFEVAICDLKASASSRLN
jgi:hypothetical protein